MLVIRLSGQILRVGGLKSKYTSQALHALITVFDAAGFYFRCNTTAMR